MCDPFGTKKAAKKARDIAAGADAETKAQEAKRQADILQGNTNIDTAFAQYTPEYYDTYKGAYTGTQNPQIDEQYARAVDKLTAALAGRGTLDSTVGAAKMAEAKAINDRSRIQVANEAENAAGELKGRISDKKTSLYALNQAAADPQGISAQATGAATALAAPAATSPLGDLFASILAPYAYYQQSRVNAAPPSYKYSFASPSGKVIN
jgi:chorismate mutase